MATVTSTQIFGTFLSQRVQQTDTGNALVASVTFNSLGPSEGERVRYHVDRMTRKLRKLKISDVRDAAEIASALKKGYLPG